MKGGVVIMGSLLWQDGSTHEPWKPVRKNWREKYLVPKQHFFSIKFPIRYGRYSQNNEFPIRISSLEHGYKVSTNIKVRKDDSCFLPSEQNVIFPLYTMVLSLGKNGIKDFGTAYLCPFKEDISDLESLKECVKQLSIAEGIFTNDKTYFRKKWGGVSIYVSPKLIRDNKQFSDEIFELWNEKLGNEEWLSQFQGFNEDTACILYTDGEKKGTINLDTIIAAEAQHQFEVHSFDFLLVAVTVPKNENGKKEYPTATQIGKFAQTDLRRYFQNNIKNGISTFQDSEIKNIIN